MKNMKKLAALFLVVMVILTTFAACGKTPDKLIIGAWRDSTATMGYEFKEDGSCVITYADVTIPIVNIKYTGETTGTYTMTELEDGTWNVKITYTILSKTVTTEYKVSIENNALSLTDITDGDTVVFMKYEPAPDTSASTSAAAQ